MDAIVGASTPRFKTVLGGRLPIKWHVRNLFAKLDAGTRKQVVQRARILGLIGQES